LKKLKDILPTEFIISVHGNTDIPVAGLTLDSREAKDGYLLLPCTVHRLMEALILIVRFPNGAKIIISDSNYDMPEGVTLIETKDVAKTIALNGSQIL